jgi:hypothetical protein
MATTPAFATTPKRGTSQWLSTNTANTKSDGTATAVGTDIVLAFTAGASGSWIDRIRIIPVGTTAATATTATVARVYISTIASGATTNANTQLWQEKACPLQTVDQTTTATVPVEFDAGFRLEANATILFSMHHAAAANTSWDITVLASDY